MADKPFGTEQNAVPNNPNEDQSDDGEPVSSPEGKDALQKPKKTPAQIERDRMRRRRRRQRRKIMGSIEGSESAKIPEPGKEGVTSTKELPRERRVEPVVRRVRDEAHPRPSKPGDVREPSQKQEPQLPKQPEEQKPEKSQALPESEPKEPVPEPKEPESIQHAFEEPSVVSAHSFDLDDDLVLPEPQPEPEKIVPEEIPEPEPTEADEPPEGREPPADELEKEEPMDEEMKIETPQPFGDDVVPPSEEQAEPLEEPEPVEEVPPVEEMKPVETAAQPEEPETPPQNVYIPPVLREETDDDLIFGETDHKKMVPVGRLHETDEPEDEVVPVHEVTEEPSGQTEKPVSHDEAPEGEAENKEKREPPTEEKSEKDVLQEKQTTAFKMAAFFAEAGKNAAPVLARAFRAVSGFLKKIFSSLWSFIRKIFSAFQLKYLIPLILIAAIAGGGYFAYTQQYHLAVYNAVRGFFEPKPVVHVDVHVDENDLRSFGIETALLFAQNEGSVRDRIPVQIFNADFFGRLKEPKVQGETGISAATYYGELKDQAQFVNLFQEYVKNLQTVQSLYKTDVYGMLDQSTKRDESLLKYLDQLKQSRDDSSKILDQIHINLDDLKVSYDSLTPQKGSLESDFFTALQNLEPDKSDELLKSFIDVTQKQAALKARNSALSKLADYYTTALQRLDTRISAVDKNRDALIQGIKVVDIPGSDLNMIIKGTN